MCLLRDHYHETHLIHPGLELWKARQTLSQLVSVDIPLLLLKLDYSYSRFIYSMAILKCLYIIPKYVFTQTKYYKFLDYYNTYTLHWHHHGYIWQPRCVVFITYTISITMNSCRILYPWLNHVKRFCIHFNKFQTLPILLKTVGLIGNVNFHHHAFLDVFKDRFFFNFKTLQRLSDITCYFDVTSLRWPLSSKNIKRGCQG